MKSWGKTLFSVFLTLCCICIDVQASWKEDGVALTRQWGASGSAVMVSDGTSGSIIVYPACRDGSAYLIAQHVDSLGTFLWGQNGIDICTATAAISEPQVASDGAGGAIVMWHDARSGNYDIYAQRIDASGSLRWTANGIVLCEAVADQYCAGISSDGTGGAVVIWYDNRSGESDIYVQRLNAAGTVLWTFDGAAICTAAGNQEAAVIVCDTTGETIVAWHDSRTGNNEIYAQRVDDEGAAQWTTDGIVLCTGESYPSITTDGAGGAIVTWGGVDIYAQRVNVMGAVQWASDGVAICTAPEYQTEPKIISDDSGGAIVVWKDGRNGSDNVYAQRVDTSGTVLWTANGVPLCAANWNQQLLTLTSDGASGVVAAWVDSRSGYYNDIYAQRLSVSGSIQWASESSALCTAVGNQSWPAIVGDGAGGAIAIWQDDRDGDSSYDTYAQRLDESGIVQWMEDGIAVVATVKIQRHPEIMSDSAGGGIVAWADYRDGDFDIYAQRVNASGSLLWMEEGNPLCTAQEYQWFPQMVSDGADGAIVLWNDFRNGNADIFAQRVDALGVVQWTTNGVAICSEAGDQSSPQFISDGAGGAIITWYDSRGSGYYDVYAQRVNASGVLLWTVDGVPVCTATEHQYSPAIAADGSGGAIITWKDYRSGGGGIYAQRVNAAGAAQWATNGVALCTAAEVHCIISDDQGGAIIAWMGNQNIYAQRVDSSGAVQWVVGGVALCSENATQDHPKMVHDGDGGAIVTWDDSRSGWDDIYAQRINAAGVVQWTVDGIALCDAMQDQHSLQLIADGSGGAVAAWMDCSAGFWFYCPAVYVQRVNAFGDTQWMAGGILVSPSVAVDQYLMPQVGITGDGGGGAIIAWAESRCGDLIRAQRIDAAGHVFPETATLLQTYSAAPAGAAIRIDWSLSAIDDDVRFFVNRASAPDWEFVELDRATVTRNGLAFTFTDKDCFPGMTYQYRIKCEVEGSVRRVLFETEAITIPSIPLTLYQNHPNPFNPQTVIRFYLPEAQEIFLDVYNVAGERVARLVEGKKEKGYYEVTWDGRNTSGTVCSSGVYFSRLKAGKNTISRKMVITR